MWEWFKLFLNVPPLPLSARLLVSFQLVTNLRVIVVVRQQENHIFDLEILL